MTRSFSDAFAAWAGDEEDATNGAPSQSELQRRSGEAHEAASREVVVHVLLLMARDVVLVRSRDQAALMTTVFTCVQSSR